MEGEFLIEQSVELSRLDWPPESDLASEEHFVRGYIDMRGLTWEDACEALRLEQDILLRAEGDLAGAGEALSDDEYYALYGLDVGVTAAVVALSAASCAPFTSCNGGVGHHEAHPAIGFYCRKGRVRSLLNAAEVASCGLVNGEGGFLVLYAASVAPLLLFAEELIGMKDQLKPLSRPYTRRKRQLPNRNPAQLTLGLFQDKEDST